MIFTDNRRLLKTISSIETVQPNWDIGTAHGVLIDLILRKLATKIIYSTYLVYWSAWIIAYVEHLADGIFATWHCN